jgi:hypothetical protein
MDLSIWIPATLLLGLIVLGALLAFVAACDKV